MQNQQLLMLCQRTLSGGNSNMVSSITAHKCGQFLAYGLNLLHSHLMIQDAKPKIIDGLLAPTFLM
jgi:hypothetical protein